MASMTTEQFVRAALAKLNSVEDIHGWVSKLKTRCMQGKLEIQGHTITLPILAKAEMEALRRFGPPAPPAPSSSDPSTSDSEISVSSDSAPARRLRGAGASGPRINFTGLDTAFKTGGAAGSSRAVVPGQQKPKRKTKDDNKWAALEQRAVAVTSIVGTPFIEIENLPKETVFRSDKWPPGIEGRPLSRKDRYILADIFRLLGEPVEEIDEDIAQIDERMAGSPSKKSVAYEKMEEIRADLKKQRTQLVKKWREAVENAPLEGGAVTVKASEEAKTPGKSPKNKEKLLRGSDDAFGTNALREASALASAKVAISQLLGYRVYQAKVQVGARLYLGPPRLSEAHAAQHDWAELSNLILEQGESSYESYLKGRQFLFEPEQFDRLYANSAFDSKMAEEKLKRSPADSDDGGGASPDVNLDGEVSVPSQKPRAASKTTGTQQKASATAMGKKGAMKAMKKGAMKAMKMVVKKPGKKK